MTDTRRHGPDPTHRLAGSVTIAMIGALALPLAPAPAAAQDQERQVIELTIERMVELGLRDSYRVRQLQLEVARSRSLLRAEQAGLKSRVELEIAAPEYQAISDYKWNSDLQRNELVHENTRRWEADLSIRQPVILFGFPTNGYLSLNNRVYRYTQLDDEGERDIRYYNRYFIGYNQPLFQPNRMKNELEEAQLDLESSELDYQDDVVGMVDDLTEDYYELLEDAYRLVMAGDYVVDLENASSAAREIIETNPNRAIEVDQLQVAIANAREDRNQAASDLRLQKEELKQRLRLSSADSIVVKPKLEYVPIDIDVERAVQLAQTLAPRMRQLGISLRESEINLDEAKGNDSFRMDVGLTYGREVQDPAFENLWTQPRNSYTIDVSATIPIWDWGERKHRIQAQEYSLQRSHLSIEETRSEIETNVRNEVRSLEEYKTRLVNMQANLELARQTTASTLEKYGAGEVALVDLLQTIDREASTERNFLDAFMGYQNTLQRLKELTYYDFERDIPLVERFSIEAPEVGGF